MAGFSLTLKGQEELEKKLIALSSIRWDAVVKDNMRQIYNRGKAGATPVDTGELRMSLSLNGDTVSYTKDYAPHVEYGHRTRGGGGYVAGQRYLQGNVETQRPIFIQNLIEQLQKA